MSLSFPSAAERDLHPVLRLRDEALILGASGGLQNVGFSGFSNSEAGEHHS